MGRVINDIPLIGWLLNQIVDNGAATDAVCTGNEGDFAGQGPNAVDVAHDDREFVGCEQQQNLRRVYFELYSLLTPYPDFWACQQYTDILLYNLSPVQVPQSLGNLLLNSNMQVPSTRDPLMLWKRVDRGGEQKHPAADHVAFQFP